MGFKTASRKSEQPLHDKVKPKAIAPEHDHWNVTGGQNHGQLSPIAKSAEPKEGLVNLVNESPVQAVDLLQEALQKRDYLGAIAMSAAISKRVASGPRDATADVLFRATLRVSGEGSEAIRESMKASLIERNQHGKHHLDEVQNRFSSDGGRSQTDAYGGYRYDDKLETIEHAKRDPVWGRIYANYHDDPAAAAAELQDIAAKRPEEFAQRAKQLEGLIGASRIQAQLFANRVVERKGTGSAILAASALSSVDNAMHRDLALMGQHRNDFIDGGPAERAGGWAVTMATLASSDALVMQESKEISNAAEEAIASELEESSHSQRPRSHRGVELQPYLEHALDHRLPKSARDQVRLKLLGKIAEHAQKAMNSKTKGRDQVAMSAGQFMANVALAESKNGLGMSSSAALAMIVRGASAFIPRPWKAGAEGSAALLESLESSPDKTFHIKDLRMLLHKAYVVNHRRPPGGYDSEAVGEWADEANREVDKVEAGYRKRMVDDLVENKK